MPTPLSKEASVAGAYACDRCRHRKRKCTWPPDAVVCALCKETGQTCTTTYQPRTRQSKRPPRIHSAQLNDRLQRLEVLLRSINKEEKFENRSFSSTDDVSVVYPPAMMHLLPDVGLNRRQELVHQYPIESSQPGDSDHAAAVGTTTGLSNHSHTQADIDAIDDPSVEDAVLRTLFLVPRDAFPQNKSGCYLPPPEEGAVLLREFITDFNQAIPLFEPEDIFQHFKMCYSGKADGTPLPWVVTFVVLGISYRLRATSLVSTPEDDVQAHYFLSQSLVPLANLLMTEPSLLLVQCLLAVATLLQMYPPPQPVALFVSNALRMAQTLGLQQIGTPAKSPRQTRVFWIAFFMDVSLCLSTQRLPGQRVIDIDVKVPEVTPNDRLGSISATNGASVADLLTLRVQLSLIQAKAYDGLSSVQAQKTSIESRISALGHVLADLEGFRRHPIFSQSPRDLRNLVFQSVFVHLVRLEAAFFLTKHHLYTQASNGWAKSLGNMPLEFVERIDSILVQKCFSDAARLTTMISLLSHCGNALDWEVLPALLPALCVIFTKVAHDPLSIDHLDSIMEGANVALQRVLGLAVAVPNDELSMEQETCRKLGEKAQLSVDLIRGLL